MSLFMLQMLVKEGNQDCSNMFTLKTIKVRSNFLPICFLHFFMITKNMALNKKNALMCMTEYMVTDLD